MSAYSHLKYHVRSTGWCGSEWVAERVKLGEVIRFIGLGTLTQHRVKCSFGCEAFADNDSRCDVCIAKPWSYRLTLTAAQRSNQTYENIEIMRKQVACMANSLATDVEVWAPTKLTPEGRAKLGRQRTEVILITTVCAEKVKS
jgi:hypothetical protein